MSDKITSRNIASLQFSLRWSDKAAAHNDILFARKANFWRDLFPQTLYDTLMGRTDGENFSFPAPALRLAPLFNPDKEFPVDQWQFDRRYTYPPAVEPRRGRFYPKGILKAISGVFRSNIEPFRCVNPGAADITVDFNHPLARFDAALDVTVVSVRNKQGELGGSCTAWAEVMTDGPGMQARYAGTPTDFFSDGPFLREDETADSNFYTSPRLVTHIDAQAISVISNLYGQHLSDGMSVLDLMSSWRSHVPADRNLKSLVGLGLNEEELKANPLLTGHLVHDLNREARLPFGSGEFDAIICTVSVEYLTRPFDVFEELARVLRPKGICIMTFSNRWFPPKAVSIWSRLHEFERMGLVTEYFLQSGRFDSIETSSMRGMPRPYDDPYFPRFMVSDPVYAVWGRKTAEA